MRRYLVHGGDLLLQGSLRDAREARVDHLNDLPGKGAEAGAASAAAGSELRTGNRQAGVALTNCRRCSRRLVMNFFVRTVTAPSDIAARREATELLLRSTWFYFSILCGCLIRIFTLTEFWLVGGSASTRGLWRHHLRSWV